jgi:proteasome accessory factor B
MKRKYSQAARVQSLLRILGTRHGITLAELAEEFGVAKRTIYRDLKALEDSGYPIYSEVIEGTTYWRLESSFKNVPPITFTINELIALYAGKKLFLSSHGFPSKSELESAFKKIERILPAKYQAHLERIGEMFLPLEKIFRKTEVLKEIFDVIQMALLNQNPLKVEYKPRKSTKPLPFEIHPYSLVNYRGSLYLVCFVPEKKALRYFALEGIVKAERMIGRFTIPEDFSLSDFIKVPFGIFQEKPFQVEIIFDKELSDYIQSRTWHPSQKVKILKNGKILFSMTASGKEEIKAWILAFGPKARVIAPKTLSKEIEMDLLKALASYRTP